MKVTTIINRKKRAPLRTFLVSLLVLALVASGLCWGLYRLRNGGSKSIVQSAAFTIPEYAGEDVIFLNENQPCFTEKDIERIEGEHFSDLDRLGRCGVAMAMLHQSMMPTEERESIGKIKPTGWVQEKYPGIVNSQPPYLYNRCHLIAFALTGQNANEKNLITGTRYMNVSLMLSWEQQVKKYIENTTNHVLYRVSPYFKGKELVARGVEIEAYSVEDQGEGVCFHIFIYNVQPQIEINYKNGESRVADQDEGSELLRYVD